MKRAKVLEKRQNKAIEQKAGLLKNIDVAENLKIHPEKYHADRLLELKDASLYYGGEASGSACREGTAVGNPAC